MVRKIDFGVIAVKNQGNKIENDINIRKMKIKFKECMSSRVRYGAPIDKNHDFLIKKFIKKIINKWNGNGD